MSSQPEGSKHFAPSPSVTSAQLDMLTLLLASTEQGFWFIDNQLLTTDANPAMCRMLRTTREQLLGRSIYDFVDEANAAVFRHHVALRSQGVADGYEITLTRRDGTQVDCFNNATPVFDSQGRKIGAIGLFSDISAQKRDQRQLALTSELLAQKSQVLERTLDSLEQGVLSIDAQERVNAYNRRFLELMQLPDGLMRSQPRLRDIVEYQLQAGHFSGEMRESAERDLAEARRDGVGLGRGMARGSYRRQSVDGRLLEVQTHPAADGGIVRTYTDVTERVRAEEALIAAKELAERANRAKSEFLSRMSHELRTPMNAILGFGQLLESDTEHPLNPVQAQRVHELLRGGRHLLELINEVLDLARIEAGALQLELAPVAMWPLVEECLQLVTPMAQRRGLDWQLVPLDAALHVRADATRLKQVLLNLLSNAIKYNREGGHVELAGAHDGDHLVLSVRDQGPGLSELQQQRLFHAFERLDAQHSTIEGTGIGLALSKQLVDTMGGEIGVQSVAGEGSCFWIRLPCCDAPLTPAASRSAEAMRPPPSQSRRVLYIEDNEVNQVLMAGMLAQRPGIELDMASLPEDGLRLATASRYDLILLDIQLPGIDGLEVLRRLRAAPATARVPVVAVSANAMHSDLEAARAAGFDEYLTKPLEMRTLLAAIDRILADD